MTRLTETAELPLADFTREISQRDIPVGDLRAAVDLLTHKVGWERYESMVPVAKPADMGLDNLRILRRVKNLMTPTVKIFEYTGTVDEDMSRWSVLVPLIP